MRLLVSIDAWGARLLSVLAIAPALSCGGDVTADEGSGGSGGTGSNASAASASTGDRKSVV